MLPSDWSSIDVESHGGRDGNSSDRSSAEWIRIGGTGRCRGRRQSGSGRMSMNSRTRERSTSARSNVM